MGDLDSKPSPGPQIRSRIVIYLAIIALVVIALYRFGGHGDQQVQGPSTAASVDHGDTRPTVDQTEDPFSAGSTPEDQAAQ